MARGSSLEVLGVSPAERPGDDLVGGRIRALPNADQGSLTIQGWVLGRRSRATAIELVNGTEVVGRVDVGLKRPDVAERFPELADARTCGFRMTVKPEGKGESQLLARAILEDGTVTPIESVRVRVSRPGGLRRLLS